jgi:hypothetical protein
MWRERIRLWSAVAVCAVIVPIGFICYLAADYLIRLWRDVQYWRWRRKHFG